MKYQRELNPVTAINQFVSTHHYSATTLNLILEHSLYLRLNNILNTQCGAELFELGLLPLQPIADATSLEEVKNIMDVYLQAARFYHAHYYQLYDMIREPWFTTAIKKGDYHYWDELTTRTLQFETLSERQLGVYIRDTMAHVNPVLR